MTVPLEPWLDKLGIAFNPNRSGNQPIKCPSPEHDDSTASASLNLGKQLWNCFQGDTEVITWDGVRPIAELAGSSHKLLTTKGWRVAPVREYGAQRLWELRLRRNGRKKVLFATAGHRWFVRQGGRDFTERVTEALRPGDRLRPAKMGHRRTKPMPWGVAHGFAFGDGHVGASWARVTLFGDKDAALMPYFPNCPTYHTTTLGGVEGVLVDRLPRFFKKLPDLDESHSYLYGWLAGLFAADGCVDTKGCPSLASASRETLQFVRDLCNRIGVLTYDIRTQVRQGYGPRPSEIHTLTLSRASLGEEFFIIDSHRRRYMASRAVVERPGWVVESVTETDRTELVYCAEVEGVGNFVLQDHIVTGNCFACGAGGSVVDLLMEVEGIPLGEALARTEAGDTGSGGEVPRQPGRSSLGLPRKQGHRRGNGGHVSPWSGFR